MILCVEQSKILVFPVLLCAALDLRIHLTAEIVPNMAIDFRYLKNVGLAFGITLLSVVGAEI